VRFPFAFALLSVPGLAAAAPASVELGDARLTTTFATSTDPTRLDDLQLTLERGGKLVWRRQGWSAIAGGSAVPAALTRGCDTLEVYVQKQQLGKHVGARIDIACRTGEDFFQADSAAILVDTIDPYAVLWAGPSDHVENELDACVTEHLVTFQLKGRSLIEHLVDTTLKNADGSCRVGGKAGKPRTTRRTVTIAL
jgi:hypothetical protein